MFLHLGGDVLINKHEIIAILDLDSAGNAQATKDFLRKAPRETCINIGDKEKSVIITSKEIYLSPISSYTLLKRANLGILEVE